MKRLCTGNALKYFFEKGLLKIYYIRVSLKKKKGGKANFFVCPKSLVFRFATTELIGKSVAREGCYK